MAKERKRLEALAEIFKSEELYINDLKIWGEEFRMYLFQSETLTIEKKHSLSKSLFVNLDCIIALHVRILNELKRRNKLIEEAEGVTFIKLDGSFQITEEIALKYKELEYHSVYYKYLNRLSIYKYYVSRLPTVEFNLDKECTLNEHFAVELSTFFRNKNIDLGPKHFIYRASQKLARYTILWKALLHYEENPVYIKGIEELMKNIKEITLEVDKTYGAVSESYRVYRFSSELHYADSVERPLPLNLFQKKRKILKEADLIVKAKYIKEPKELRFILLDTVILLCDVVRQDNVEIKYIISDPLPLYKYTVTDKNIGFSIENIQLQNMKKLFLLERGGVDIVILFFKDLSSRRMIQNIIEMAISKQRNQFNENIKVIPILEATSIKMSCCATKDSNYVWAEKEMLENKDISIEKDENVSGESIHSNNFSRDMQVNYKKFSDKKDENLRNKEEDSNNKDNILSSDNEQNISSHVTLKNIHKKENEFNENESIFSDDFHDFSKLDIQEKDRDRDSSEELFLSTREDSDFLKSEKSEKTQKNEKSEDSLKTEKTQNYEENQDFLKTGENEKNEDSLKSEDTPKSKKSEDSLKTEKNDDSLKSEKSEKTPNSEKTSNDEKTEEKSPEKPRKSFIQRLLFPEKNKKLTKRCSINHHAGDFTKTFRFDEQFLIFGTDEGLFVKKGPDFVNIYENSVKKVIYDVNNKIILLYTENKVKFASFTPIHKNIEPQTIIENVNDFFYGSTGNKLTLATLMVSNNSTTTICLFKIILENDQFSVIMDRKLFVGCLVFDIKYFETKLVIACRDFEMVDSDTLKTQQLVDPLDLCVPFYFKDLKNIIALSVFTISKNLFLVCYDTIGFFIDKYGRTVDQNIVFVWYSKPLKFRAFRNYIICLSKNEITIFSLQTGNIVFFSKINNLSFVEGCTSLLLHDSNNLYKVINL